jgi:hypothetical protein
VSRSEDRRRAKEAGYKGYYAGLEGAQLSENPYKLIAAAGTGVAWRNGWERGYAERRKKRMDCSGCDALSLQRVTTRGEFCDVAFEARVPGKKPYLVRCKKCGRTWKTNARYAMWLAGDLNLLRKETS